MIAPEEWSRRREHQIVDFVTRFVDEHGYSPTLREIGRAIGLSSSSTISNHVSSAVMRRALTSGDLKGRTLRPVRDRCDVCGRP